jgi:hypothetical protein
MPHSTNKFKQEIVDFVKNKFNKTSTVLDIGAGSGTYADFFRDHFYGMDGVEIFEPYVDQFALREKYKNLFIQDATTFDFNYYDLIIVGDILEHIEESEGIKFIERIYEKCNDLIIGIPFNSEQGVYYDNKYEIHLQPNLTNESFLEKYKGFRPLCIRYDYGIYIKDNQSNKKLDIFLDSTQLDFENVKQQLENQYQDCKVISYLKEEPQKLSKSKLTVVTGLWDIGRPGRSFEHYIECFQKLLETDCNMYIHISAKHEYLVWEKRDRSNTVVKIWELEDMKQMYGSFWDKTQQIRNDPAWYNMTGENGWLKNSPQAVLEWYNPIVMSKFSMLHNVTVWDPFESEYFMWLDAGITNTVYEKYFTEHKILDKIIPHFDPFLFLSYPYEANDEIHGFDFNAINRYAGETVKYVCRGGLFGGTRESIISGNSMYWHLLNNTLRDGYMGTEESIFSIMAYQEPHTFKRYALDSNGLIVKFAQNLLEDNIQLEPVPEGKVAPIVKKVNTSNLKMSIYMLTFNFPKQVEHTIQTWLKHDKFLTQTRNILIDNSTNEEARIANKALCDKYNFEHIITNENTGINGGRMRAAQHFQESDSDYYLFLEDDMGIHAPDQTGYCRNGFRFYVPNLYDTALKIIEGSDIDFLKLSYTEVYMDNNIQVSWYNVPQTVRSEFWPNYDKLPTNGLDPNCPRTKFDSIEVVDGVSYITGDIYYCNWPTIAGKKGNQKMFLDTTWARPYEQTWMSYMFQETQKGNLKPAVLLASPINHNRIEFYTPEERREN